MMTRQWNVVAGIAGVVTLGYVAVYAGALFMGKATLSEFSGAVLPVMTAWGGYLAALLPKNDG